jgi:hypothetical protein
VCVCHCVVFPRAPPAPPAPPRPRLPWCTLLTIATRVSGMVGPLWPASSLLAWPSSPSSWPWNGKEVLGHGQVVGHASRSTPGPRRLCVCARFASPPASVYAMYASLVMGMWTVGSPRGRETGWRRQGVRVSERVVVPYPPGTTRTTSTRQRAGSQWIPPRCTATTPGRTTKSPMCLTVLGAAPCGSSPEAFLMPSCPHALLPSCHQSSPAALCPPLPLVGCSTNVPVSFRGNTAVANTLCVIFGFQSETDHAIYDGGSRNRIRVIGASGRGTGVGGGAAPSSFPHQSARGPAPSLLSTACHKL